MNVEAHSGHLGNGVQQHSCGHLYPWTIVEKGNLEVGAVYALNGETGEELTHHRFVGRGQLIGQNLFAYDLAVADAKSRFRGEPTPSERLVGGVQLQVA